MRAPTALAMVLAFGLVATQAPAEDRTKKLPVEPQSTSSIRHIAASGNVKVVQNDRMVVAGKALFDNSKRTITLTENPRLWQGSDVVTAHTIILHLDENRTEMLGEGGEITVLLNPRQQKQESAKGRDVALIGRDQPIQVTARKATGENLPGGKELTFEGAVRVRQGEVTLTCDKLVVTFQEEKRSSGLQAGVRGSSGG